MSGCGAGSYISVQYKGKICGAAGEGEIRQRFEDGGKSMCEEERAELTSWGGEGVGGDADGGKRALGGVTGEYSSVC